MKNKKPQLSPPRINIGALFGRFHLIMFTIIVGGGLTAAVYLLTTILETSSTQGYTPESVNTTFDTETIERVEQLRTLSTPPTSPELPSGRTDPFPR